jgi:hypothetical protein
MARNRRPTGRKPGRPTLVDQVSAALLTSKSKAAKMLLKKIEAEPVHDIPTGMLVLANESIKHVAAALGQPVKHTELTAPMVIAGDTPGEQADSAISQTLERMHPKVLIALQDLAREDSKAFVSAWLELVQYKLPKLSKQDVTGTLQHQVSTFVPVEQRNIELVQQPDGAYAPAED